MARCLFDCAKTRAMAYGRLSFGKHNWEWVLWLLGARGLWVCFKLCHEPAILRPKPETPKPQSSTLLRTAWKHGITACVKFTHRQPDCFLLLGAGRGGGEKLPCQGHDNTLHQRSVNPEDQNHHKHRTVMAEAGCCWSALARRSSSASSFSKSNFMMQKKHVGGSGFRLFRVVLWSGIRRPLPTPLEKESRIRVSCMVPQDWL